MDVVVAYHSRFECSEWPNEATTCPFPSETHQNTLAGTTYLAQCCHHTTLIGRDLLQAQLPRMMKVPLQSLILSLVFVLTGSNVVQPSTERTETFNEPFNTFVYPVSRESYAGLLQTQLRGRFKIHADLELLDRYPILPTELVAHVRAKRPALDIFRSARQARDI